MSIPVHRPHVLVLEDTPAILDLLRDLLEDEGYRVSTSEEPLGLAAIAALAPDIIVLDLLFAHTLDAGWQFMTMVRLDPALRRLPLILCTAMAERVQEPAMAVQLHQQGIRVLLKPFDLKDLVTIVGEELIAQNLIDQALADA